MLKYKKALNPRKILSYLRFAYFPFGGGHIWWAYIGNEFAMMEIRLILATLMQQYQLDLYARTGCRNRAIDYNTSSLWLINESQKAIK